MILNFSHVKQYSLASNYLYGAEFSATKPERDYIGGSMAHDTLIVGHMDIRLAKSFLALFGPGRALYSLLCVWLCRVLVVYCVLHFKHSQRNLY